MLPIYKVHADGIGLKHDAYERNVNRLAKAGYTTFTVALRVIQGDEKRSGVPGGGHKYGDLAIPVGGWGQA